MWRIVKKLEFVIGLLFEFAMKRLLRPSNVYSLLAISSLSFCAGAWITPWWQPVLEKLSSNFTNPPSEIPLSPLLAGGIFLILTFIFAYLAKKSVTNQRESIVDTVSLTGPVTAGNSRVYCYCGSLLGVLNIDVIVASENKDFDIASLSSTSVSGRVRRLAASFDASGGLIEDSLGDYINKKKKDLPYSGPYRLGQCFVSPPFAAYSRGVKAIVHAVAIEKRGSGVVLIEEAANREIIEFAINYCNTNHLNSIFIPVFGLGSGQLQADESIRQTLSPLISILKSSSAAVDVYIGTYRNSDAALVSAFLLRN
ncbi:MULTISPECIES: hypothetical protein [unclassified Methylophilus]|uniref:hypothetical protein n=1 Tax=unclassified Methylophilus TaxID=2630143 RepID=UPI0006F5D82F|nr:MULTISPECIES: hypothetical protein [unclassified Methylophilus]KQT43818.1 hypothetical protein ASG34_03330 [Methylophilus sp. Leaf416]KQT59302.1 hypothetical protein ASG44_03335 [Methylophilus sp. Leaf459]